MLTIIKIILKKLGFSGCPHKDDKNGFNSLGAEKPQAIRCIDMYIQFHENSS